LVESCTAWNLDQLLGLTNARRYFRAVMGRSGNVESRTPKCPDPATKLGVAPSRRVVFEDAVAGE